MAANLISEAATRKLSRLKPSYAAMSPEEQLAFTRSLRARRRAPERPLKAATISRRAKDAPGIPLETALAIKELANAINEETTDAVQDS